MSQEAIEYVVTQLHSDIEHWVTNRFPPILTILSPPGAGKTTAVRRVCEIHKDEFPYVVIPAVRGAHLSDFFGVWVLRDGQTVFQEGPLYKGLLQKNCIIVIDDAHTLGPDLQLFNSLGDGTGQMSCAELGVTLDIAPGVRLILVANPPSPDLPSWERSQWEIPEQILSRSRVLRLEHGLSVEDEKAIFKATWDAMGLSELGHPTSIREGMHEVMVHLRATPALGSCPPSVRDAVTFCHLLAQCLSVGQAFLQSIGYKPTSSEGRAAAVETFQAKFGFGPDEQSATLFDGGTP